MALLYKRCLQFEISLSAAGNTQQAGMIDPGGCYYLGRPVFFLVWNDPKSAQLFHLHLVFGGCFC